MTKKEDKGRDPSTASQIKNTSATPSSSGVGLSGVVLGAVLSFTAHLIYR